MYRVGSGVSGLKIYQGPFPIRGVTEGDLVGITKHEMREVNIP